MHSKRPNVSRVMPLVMLATALACSEPAPPPSILSDLDEGNRELFADYLAPSEDESRWRAIPWLPTFAEGLRTAGEQKRPLLFWAMNGHPLGCT